VGEQLRQMLKYKHAEIFLQLVSAMRKGTKKQILRMVFFALLLAFLDLLGVGSALVVIYIVFSESIGTESNDFILTVLEVTRLNELSFNIRVLLVSSLVVSAFVTKSILGITLSSRINKFLSRESIELGNVYIGKIFRMPYSFLINKKGQKILQAATTGLENLYTNYLGGLINISVEVVVVTVLFFSLFLLEPIGIAVILVFFAISVLPLNILLGRSLNKNGQLLTEKNLIASSLILDGLSIFRETQISNRQDYIVELSSQARVKLIGIKARIYTLNIMTKYVVEIVTIVSGIAFAGIQVWISDIRSAIQSILIFGLVSSRILPSLLKIHNTVLSLKQSQGQARISIDLLREIDANNSELSRSSAKYESHSFNSQNSVEFASKIEFSEVCYSHKADLNRNHVFAIKDISFDIQPGESIGILGRSGSGKSTLLELILGLRDPDVGRIRISGESPRNAIAKWPGSMAFVPQETKVIDLSISENIGLTKQIDETLVIECLEVAQLADLFSDKEIRPDEKLGEFRNRISGGEKQRLAIARALYTKPDLLVLDESTSAIDLETEKLLLDKLFQQNLSRTVVMVTHRPSTLLYMDRVMYLKNGQIIDFDRIDLLRTRHYEIEKLFKYEKPEPNYEK